MSRFIPNSFQVPNIYSDKIFPYLTESELRCALYACRRIYGFGKMDGRGRISLEQFINGTEVDGFQVDHGTGLSRNAVIAALARLEEYRLMRKVDKGEPARHIPAEWELETAEENINMSGLLNRKAERRRKGSKRSANFERGSTDERRRGSTDERRRGSTDERRRGSTDERRRSSTDERRRGSTYERPIYRNTDLETQSLENQSDLDLSSSSSLHSDLVPSKRDDDDDDFGLLVELLCAEFSLTVTETIRDTVQDWLSEKPASHVEAAIKRAVLYSPRHPLVYVSSILRNEVEETPAMPEPHIGAAIPGKLAELVRNASATAIPEPSEESDLIWRQVLGELRTQMPAVGFDTWIKPASAAGFDLEGNFVVVAADDYAAGYLRTNHKTRIERILGKITESQCPVRFVAM